MRWTGKGSTTSPAVNASSSALLPRNYSSAENAVLLALRGSEPPFSAASKANIEFVVRRAQLVVQLGSGAVQPLVAIQPAVTSVVIRCVASM